MSVFILDRLLELGGAAEDALAGHDGFGLAQLTVADIRKERLGIQFTPTDQTPLGQSHADVYCKKRDAIQKHLRDASTIIVEPTQDVT
jgi:hypothetical protein